MDKSRADSVLDLYQTRYARILGKIWPTINDNGFNEHNLTANFTAAYEAVAANHREETSAWFEFQIPNGKRNNHRIDGLIVNHTRKELYLVEAKRFSKNKLTKKRGELGDDFIRINKLDLNRRFEKFFAGDESIAEYQVFGVLLFDLWTENQEEKELVGHWTAICETPDSNKLSVFFDRSIEYDDLLLPGIREVKSRRWEIKDYSYYLETLIWERAT